MTTTPDFTALDAALAKLTGLDTTPDREPDPTPEPATLTSAELAAKFAEFSPAYIRDRKIERSVTLHEAPEGSTQAVLSVMHHKEAKQFIANVKIVRVEPTSSTGFNVTTWIPFEKTHNRRLPNTPCPRYSDKALTAAAQAALDLLTAEPEWLDNLDLGPYSGSL